MNFKKPLSIANQTIKRRTVMFSSNPKKILLPSIFLIAILLVVSTATGLSQSLFDKKDLMFTQVFAGPAGSSVYMSSISVTNRGTLPYNGTLYFVTGQNNIWNPLVNGAQISGGSVDVVISPDATEVFAVTTNTFTVGYALVVSDDFSLDNYIEGNLSYFSFNGSTLMDAVGVPESKEFMIASLPFDMYADVGLSLVNPDTVPADVSVLLFDEDGGLPVANCNFTLEAGEHYAKYLTELPWLAAPVGFGTVGKVEIFVTNGVPISGIAMLVTPGSAAGTQISTLPLGGTPITYEATFDNAGVTYIGELSLWIEGFRVKAYLQMISVGGVSVVDNDVIPILLNGQLVGTELELASTTWPANTWPGIESEFGGLLYIYIGDYDPTADVLDHVANTWASYGVWDGDQAVERGDVVLDNTLF